MNIMTLTTSNLPSLLNDSLPTQQPDLSPENLTQSLEIQKMEGSQLAPDNSTQIDFSSTVTDTDEDSWKTVNTTSQDNFSQNSPSQTVSYLTNTKKESELQTLTEATSSSSALNGEIILEVTTLADIVNGSDNHLSLREAISLATANPQNAYRIELQSGQRYEMTLPFSGNFRIINGSNITIDSVGGEENAIIDASAVDNGVFYVNNSTLNLEGITVTGGSFDVYNAKGGSFFLSGNGEINLTDSEVTNSSTGYRGGAFYAKEGTITLNNSIVSNSFAQDGGAFALVEEGFSEITLHLNDSVIKNSTATNGNGGAIFATKGAEIYIDGSVFENNQSINGLGGGAIHTQGENIDSAILEINDSTFVNNIAHKSDLGAGAIYTQQTTVTITDSLFEQNNVTGALFTTEVKGGAIFFNEFTSADVKRTDFTDNGNSEINGGAIATFNESNLILEKVNFTENKGYEGGAIQLLGNKNTLTNVKFTKNTAEKAGAAWFGSQESTLNEIDFIKNNSEKEDGGAALIADQKSSWTKILLQENEAVGNGTFAITQGNHNFTDITAFNNRVNSGGVFYVSPENQEVTLDVRKSLFEENIARENGGVMYAHATSLPAEINLQEIEAKDNSSGLLGGAFNFVDRVSAQVTKSVLKGNSAAYKGGALSVYGAEVDVIDTLFEDNSAIEAGAIEVWFGVAHPLRGKLNLLNSLVYDNEVTGDAGGIRVGPGADMSIANSIIAFNSGRNASAIQLFTSLELIPEPTLTITNSSILGNKNSGTEDDGAGVFVVEGSEGEPALGNLPRFAGDLYLYNTLIDGTISGNGEAILDYGGDAPINANNNLIGSINNTTGFDQSNLLNVDSGIILQENGNYTVTGESPLIDGGDNDFLPTDIFDLNANGNQQELLPIDIIEGDRIQGEKVDIGAIESNPTPFDEIPNHNPDFNRDGKRDLVWRNQATGENVIWYMDGADRTGSAKLPEVTNLDWEIVGTGDANKDQNTDIYWRNQATGKNVIWYMNKNNLVSSAELPKVTNPDWEIVGLGDADNDSLIDDIYWRNQATGKNVIWYMDDNTRIGSAKLPEVTNLDWEIVGVGDANGDHHNDLYWRNQETGANYVWYMNGVNRTGYDPISEVGNTDWYIVA